MADPAWNAVECLLHFDESAGVELVDSSSYENAVSLAGYVPDCAEISTAVKKFGASSLYTYSNTTWVIIYLTRALGQKFCVEGQLYVDTLGEGVTFFSDGYDNLVRVRSDGKLEIVYFDEILYELKTYTGVNTVSPSQFHHIVFNCDETTIRCFLDGNIEIAEAASIDSVGMQPYIGQGISATTTSYIDEVRITVGDAIYTTAFSPPTSPFSEGEASDEFWTEEKLALETEYDY